MTAPRLVVLLLCVLASSSVVRAQPPQAVPTVDLASVQAVGRYQLVFKSEIRADTFLLDTVDGRIWRMVSLSSLPDKPSVWMREERLDSQLELGMYLIKNQSKP